MISATDTPTMKKLHYLSSLTQTISARWKDVLRQEGIGRYSVDAYSAQDEIDRILYYEKLMSFYRCDMDSLVNRERFIIEYVSPYYSTTESLQNNIIPRMSFVPRVIRNASMLYKEPPTREIAEEAQNEKYQMLISESGMNVRAKEWHRIYTLCGVVAVRPLFKKGKLTYQILSANNFTLGFDDDGIEKLMYEVPIKDEAGGITGYGIVVWTDEEHYMYENDKRVSIPGNDAMRNPYGKIPFVVMARDQDDPYTGGLSDLVDSCIHVNFLKMLESEDSAFAAISVPFGVNLWGKKQEKVAFSPRNPVMIEATQDAIAPDLKYVTGDPHSELLRNLQSAEERQASMREGIAPFMLSESPQELSGKAMKTALIELRERRQDDELLFETYERRLYEITQVIAKGEGIDFPKGEFSIQFGEQSYDDDPNAAYDLDARKTKDNLISKIDQYRQWVAEGTDEEIEEILLRNRELNARLNTPGRVSTQVIRGQEPA